MIKAVANFFAGVIGVFIILAVAAIVWGIYVAIGANMDQDAFMMGAGIAATGTAVLFSMGLTCVVLDIMFNVRKIAEDRKTTERPQVESRPRKEPEL